MKFETLASAKSIGRFPQYCIVILSISFVILSINGLVYFIKNFIYVKKKSEKINRRYYIHPL